MIWQAFWKVMIKLVDNISAAKTSKTGLDIPPP